ncbi:hypothetical protein [Sinimarinibacterium sp. NLF-5-8]|uniref:hypothetical protein n=1 Tax=Sinimarinibacterium sp. NLF-5-8 TaxID=2698684 RepID=UPI00137BF52F|nr:hypothetical protein [Sinimarinibacterium sp. NLF-5-8]QHS10296.1 hypothetical protein GT972_09215 [Sinimarinibacterium sp. NLF-5-8]
MINKPVDHALDLTTQSVLTFGSYGVWIVVLLIAIKMGRQQKTPFYVFIIFASAFGAIFEPLYDEGMMLYFYSIDQWTIYTSFGTPQPVWTLSGYVTLYGANAIFICDRIRKGMSRNSLYVWALLTYICSCMFEMYGINGIEGGAYEYYGPHAFRIFNYPLVIGILETAQVICFSFAAAKLRQHTTGWAPLLGLFILFPCIFYFSNFGAGAPTIVTIHLDTPNPLAVQIGTLISISFALILIWAVGKFLPPATQDQHA